MPKSPLEEMLAREVGKFDPEQLAEAVRKLRLARTPAPQTTKQRKAARPKAEQTPDQTGKESGSRLELPGGGEVASGHGFAH